MYFEIQGTYFKINALYFQTSALCFFYCVEAAKKSTNPGSVFVEKVFVFTCCSYCFFAYCRVHEYTFVPCNRNKNSVVVTLIFSVGIMCCILFCLLCIYGIRIFVCLIYHV